MAKPRNLDEYLGLRKRLEEAADAYHGGAEPVMDDAQYDLEARALAEAEAAHPDWAGNDPFSRRVGGRVRARRSVPHEHPMLSLDNIFSPEELRAWTERLGGEVPLMVEPKLDGLAIAATYQKGRLVGIATRGDGREGEDVTDAPVRIAGLPTLLAAPVDLQVRGEVCMTEQDFEEANRIRAGENMRPLSNPRNGAAGAMLSLPDRTSVPVTFWAYDLVGGGDLSDSFELLRSLGVQVSLDVWHAEEGESVEAAVQRLQQQRGDLPVSIDGAVIKAGRAADRQMGSTSRAPRWAVAYKFPAEMRRSRVVGIDLQVGRGGSITPVARITPVEVGGATVSSVNLHNHNDIARKDIRIGDLVYVRRAGDVIPDIVGPVVEDRIKGSKRWTPPDACPDCRGPIELGQGRMRCRNRCGGVRTLVWAAGREALDLDGAGTELIAAAAAAGLLHDVPSLYELSARTDELATLLVNGRRFGRRRAEQVAAAAGAARRHPAWRHLSALGFEHVGVATAKALAAELRGLDQVLAADVEDLQKVSGVGMVVAASLHQEIRERAEEITRLLRLVDAAEEPAPDERRSSGGGKLDGLRVAVSGTFPSYSRAELIALVERNGGQIVGSVSRRTDILVKGEGGGGKMRDAEKHGVTVVDEARLSRIISGEEQL